MRKISRHDAAPISHPPTNGPSAPAIPPSPDQAPMAGPRSSCRNDASMMRERAGRQQRPAHALQRASGDQRLDVGRDRAQQRGDREPGDADDEHPPPPVAIAERPAEQQEPGERQRVGVDRPLQPVERGVEIAPDGRQRDVDDGRVEERDARAEHGREQHPPAAANCRRRSPARRVRRRRPSRDCPIPRTANGGAVVYARRMGRSRDDGSNRLPARARPAVRDRRVPGARAGARPDPGARDGGRRLRLRPAHVARRGAVPDGRPRGGRPRDGRPRGGARAASGRPTPWASRWRRAIASPTPTSRRAARAGRASTATSAAPTATPRASRSRSTTRRTSTARTATTTCCAAGSGCSACPTPCRTT